MTTRQHLRLMVTAHICPDHPDLRKYDINKLKNEYFESHGKNSYFYFKEEDFIFSGGKDDKSAEILTQLTDLLTRKKIPFTEDTIHMFIPIDDVYQIEVGSDLDSGDIIKKKDYYFLIESEGENGNSIIMVNVISIHVDPFTEDDLFYGVTLKHNLPFSQLLKQTNLQNLFDIVETFGKRKAIHSIL